MLPQAITSLAACLYALAQPLPGDGACKPLLQPRHGVLPVANGDDSAAARQQRRSGLPMARGRTFGSLDEYLDYLKSRSTIDAGWYEEVSPGVYRLMTMTPPGEGEVTLFTRAELMAKLGFSR